MGPTGQANMAPPLIFFKDFQASQALGHASGWAGISEGFFVANE
jgi:hypothetical protein